MKLVIKPHNPIKKYIFWAIFGVSTCLITAIVVDYGSWKYLSSIVEHNNHYQKLLEEVAQLKKENKRLYLDIARLEKVREADRRIRADNHLALVDSEKKISQLEGELDFYRAIVRSSEIDKGPRVKGVRIKQLHGESRFGYKIVLTYINKQHKYAEGSLKFALRGVSNGNKIVYSHKELAESGNKTMKFKFKHFHLLEGTFKLPDAITPLQIEVSISDSRGRTIGEKNIYDWITVVN